MTGSGASTQLTDVRVEQYYDSKGRAINGRYAFDGDYVSTPLDEDLAAELSSGKQRDLIAGFEFMGEFRDPADVDALTVGSPDGPSGAIVCRVHDRAAAAWLAFVKK